MPDRHHRSRNPNVESRNPDRGTRDWDEGRDYRRDGRKSQYREAGSTVYSEDRHPHREPDQFTDTSPYEFQHREVPYNLRYIPTSRGICQAIEVLLNLLIIICAGVPYSNNNQYQDIASLGGLYYYYYGGAQAFSGQDLVRVKQLDAQFYQLKLPPYICSMAFGGALMTYALAMLLLGVFRVPFRWPPVLLAEAVLDGLISLGYIPALAFYFIKLQETYSTTVCKEREELYKSKGYASNECRLGGTDVAGGLFGVLGVILFMLSAVFAIRAFITVRRMKQQREPEDNTL